ncbi:MAG: S8 family serine peptidase [Bacteroidales bacterium]|nr:S8 family serine peptidase [Bacteroidales bacterium]
MRKSLITIIIFIVAATAGFSQERLLSDQSVFERKSTITALPPDGARIEAVEYARRHNLPERLVYEDGTVMEIKRLSPTGKPLYNRTFNLNAAKTISSDKVWEGGSSGLDLSGAGILVGVWDEAQVRTTHDEFGGRASVLDNSTELSDHATHVAGTVGAAGLTGSVRGMANKSRIDSYDWNNDDAEIRTAAGQGLLISNHSYGFAQGFEYDPGKSRWEWWGDQGISETEDYNFGFYGQDSRSWDEVAYDHPKYLLVKSAGNDRGDGPAAGATHYIWTNGAWVESTTVRDLDGGNDGFDCLGSRSTAKNILTIGAVADITGGYEQPSDVDLASFSVFGPTDDGRIKPDIVANGMGVYSTTSGSDTSYGSKSGTSMSSPSVAGSMALLQQHFRSLHGTYMYASQLKSLVLHTADEAGNPGPDYKHGWGLMNTARAAELLSTVPSDRFFYDTLQNQETQELVLFSRGTEPVRITIVWTDPAGEIPGPQLNPTNRILVNDLDIRLTRQVDEQIFRPYVLDPANPSATAQTGDNNLDNVEQIYLDQPMVGFYTLQISHKTSLSNTMQPYAILVTGLETDYVASGYNELNDANGAILLTSADYYLNNMDVQWFINPGNGQPVSIYFDYLETETDQDMLSIYDGANDSAPLLAEFSGILELTDITVTGSSDELFITFVSDNQVTAKGFLARYCTVAPEGEYAIVGEQYPCESTTDSYFALGQEGANFIWDSDLGWSIQEKSFNGIDLDIGATYGTLSVTPVNRCGSGNLSDIAILPLAAPPVLDFIEGDTVPCAGQSTRLHTNSLPGTTYKWELPPYWAGASESDTIFYKPASKGSVIVAGYNACGKGNELSKYIDVLDVPVKPSILSDHIPPCTNTVQDFYVPGVPGNEYLWETQNDWTILGDPYGDTVSIAVGEAQSFLFVNSSNKCGSNRTNRLFLTAPTPPEPRVAELEGSNGYPELQVTNDVEFSSIQWYRNQESVPGANGRSNPLVVNLNGFYTVESVSDKGCRTMIAEADGINVKLDHLAFLAYRVSKSTVAILNTTTRYTEFQIIGISGKVMFTGRLQPGYNEILFPFNGIFVVRLNESGIGANFKVLF